MAETNVDAEVDRILTPKDQVGEAEFRAMTDAQRVQARKDGRLKDLLSTPTRRGNRG